MERMRIVIICGGESKRFGGNKLLAKINDKRVIERVFDLALRYTDEVYFSIKNDRQLELYSKVLGLSKEQFIIDHPNFPNSPLNGFLTAIFGHGLENVLFIPGDSPWVSQDTFERLIRELSKAEILSTLIWGNGQLENMWLYYKCGLDIEIYELYDGINMRRRATDLLRISTSTLYVPVSKITDNPREFSDIDYISDLHNSRIEGELYGPIDDTIEIKHSCIYANPFYRALRHLKAGNLDSAIRYLYLEMEYYLKEGIMHIISHIARDIFEAIETYKS